MAGEVRIGGNTASVKLQGNDSITTDQTFTFPDTGGTIVTDDFTGDVEIDGNITAADNVTAKGGCYAPAGIDQGNAVVLNPAGLVQLRRDGGRNDVFVCYNGGNANGNRTIRLYNNGDADFSGSVNPNVVITRSVIIDLEPNNPSNYTSTTNAEGETESVYSGPTLDVKALLLEFQSKIQTLEAAKASLEARLTTLEGGAS